MKAIWLTEFGDPTALRTTDVALPSPAPGEVLIATSVAEANFADMLLIEGRYQIRPPLPFAPGLSAAGRVVAVGEGVDDAMIGRRVLATVTYGAFAETFRARTASCYPIPDDIGDRDAASLNMAYQTAWFALTARGRLVAGDHVLVLGAAGGVGLAAVELAKALNAGCVIAATRGAEKCELARAHGADLAIDITRADIKDALKREVMAATGGHGADVIVDPVGGAAFAAALRAAAWCGRLVTLGFASGEIPQVAAGLLLVKNIEVSGLQWTDYRDRQPQVTAAAQQSIFQFYRDGKLSPPVAGRYGLNRIGEAFAAIRQGAVGRALIEIGC